MIGVRATGLCCPCPWRSGARGGAALDLELWAFSPQPLDTTVDRLGGGHGSVEITDDDKSYELIATLRHQTRWNRYGAIFAAVVLVLQTVPQLIQ